MAGEGNYDRHPTIRRHLTVLVARSPVTSNGDCKSAVADSAARLTEIILVNRHSSAYGT